MRSSGDTWLGLARSVVTRTKSRIACFVAPYGEADRTGKGGGVDEDEHIEVLEIPFGEALTMIESGAIADAKTIALLYYAKAKGLIAPGG